MDILNLYDKVKDRYSIKFDLKDEQREIIHNVLIKKHCMGILPTGFGKSMTYALPPLLLDEANPDEHHVCLVISPLRSAMQDQVETYRKHGVKAAAIFKLSEMTQETIDGIVSGEFSIVFSSPEAINSDYWMRIMRSRRFRSMVCLVAIDEAHCVITWGNDFREEYGKLNWVGPVMKNAPLLFLTATCTEKMKNEILEKFSVTNVQITAAVPNRSNIFLKYKSKPGMKFEEELSFYIDELKSKGEAARKCIIFTLVNPASNIYEEIVDRLQDKRFTEDGNQLVDMYVAKTTEEAKQNIIKIFPTEKSSIRCLIASSAFGMGVNVPDVDLVIHWGVCSSILEYWQQVGRCGRDGRPCEAIMLATPKTLSMKKKIEESVQKMHTHVKTEKKCMRLVILKALYLECMPPREIARVSKKVQCDGTCKPHGKCFCQLCLCCCNCRNTCSCFT